MTNKAVATGSPGRNAIVRVPGIVGRGGLKRRPKKHRPEAILLLGPTGSGKSPLGEALEKHGFDGLRCVHLDFGANLREVAALKRRPLGFTAQDRNVIRDSLRTGALLENENFPIAEKVMERFRRKCRMKKDDLLVLNGLPRHEGQAADLERTVHVTLVVYLNASPAVTRERIRRNVDSDRSGRVDDSAEEVRRKYAIFRKRTKPLLDFYASRDARIRSIPIGVNSTAADMLRTLAG